MIPVLVTTDKDRRGVFFGYLESEDDSRGTILTLINARNCVKWSMETHGVFGLASRGPDANCRIGPRMPRLIINGVTAVAYVAPEAVIRFESEPWNTKS